MSTTTHHRNGCHWQAGSNQVDLLRSFQLASVSAEPAIEAQTLFLAINELHGALLGAEIDRLESLIRERFPDIRHVDIEPDGINLSSWRSLHFGKVGT